MKSNLKGKCSICGSTEDLVRHHVSYDPEIIDILCRRCHSSLHAKRYWRTGTPYKPPSSSGKRQITIVIDEELLLAVDIQAQKKGISRADYIRLAITDRLRRDLKAGRS